MMHLLLAVAIGMIAFVGFIVVVGWLRPSDDMYVSQTWINEHVPVSRSDR